MMSCLVHLTTCHISSGNCFKLVAAGNLNNSDGSLNNRGSNGNYWSSTQNDNSIGRNLNFNSSNCNMNNNNKANGRTLRCLRDFVLARVPGGLPRGPF